jgi:hypothetical protein
MPAGIPFVLFEGVGEKKVKKRGEKRGKSKLFESNPRPQSSMPFLFLDDICM